MNREYGLELLRNFREWNHILIMMNSLKLQDNLTLLRK
nr:MAG TPA: hypothetical protein [Crassvirales sp.]